MCRGKQFLSTISRKSKHDACHMKGSFFVACIYLSKICKILLLEIIKESKNLKKFKMFYLYPLGSLSTVSCENRDFVILKHVYTHIYKAIITNILFY